VADHRRGAKIGIYGIDFMANAVSDPTGISMMLSLEELAWGDAGSAWPSWHDAGGRGHHGQRHAEQQMTWSPVLRYADDIKLAAFGVSEPDAGSDVSSLRTRAVYDQASDEWVLNGTKTWITNGGIANLHVIVASVDPSSDLGSGVLHRARGHQGHPHGQKFKKMGIRASHTAEVVLEECACRARAARGKERLDEKLARVREGKKASGQAPWPPSRRPVPRSGPKPSHRARRLRVLARLRQGAQAVRRAIIENQGIASSSPT